MNLLMSNFIYVFHPIDLHLLQNILSSKEFNNHLHILLLSLHMCTMMLSFLLILAKSPHIIQFLMETSIVVHLLISFSTLYATLLVIHHTLGVIILKPFHLSWIFLIVQVSAPTSNTLLFIRYFYLVPINFSYYNLISLYVKVPISFVIIDLRSPYVLITLSLIPLLLLSTTLFKRLFM